MFAIGVSLNERKIDVKEGRKEGRKGRRERERRKEGE